jgi:hypothetical protein
MKNKMRIESPQAAQADDLFQASGATLSKHKLHSPAPEQIRQRAFEIHKAQGGGHGRALDDWLQAEREFLAEQEHPAGFCNWAFGGEWQNTEQLCTK